MRKPHDASTGMTATHRRGRRRRLVLWSLPVVLLVLLAAARLFSLSVINEHGRDQFAEQHFEESAETFASLQRVNLVERYLPHFNHGDALLAQDKLEPARKEFERALRLAPTERSCMVRYNLVRTIELLGDRALTESGRPDAVARWREAKSVIADGSCPRDHVNGPGDRLAEADRRLDEKLEPPESDPPTPPPPSPQPQPQPTPSPSPSTPQGPSEEQRRQLKERNQRGEGRHREQQEQDEDDQFGSEPQDPNARNW